MPEYDLIQTYFAGLATAPHALGLSDDVAILPAAASPRIITVDALVEGVHFLPEDPLETVARKLYRANRSDLVAKGAVPEAALLTLAWPSRRDEHDLQPFADALGEELASDGAALIGGDTVSHQDHLVLSLTLTGLCRGDGPVMRRGAAPGDGVWTVGPIGAAYLGLQAAQGALEARWRITDYREPPRPPLALAGLIAQHARAGLDLSDGLLSDAAKLASNSGVRLSLDADAVPWSDPEADIAGKLAQATGGDDYVPLFTAPETAAETLREAGLAMGLELARIGTVEAGEGVGLQSGGRDIPLPARLGFEHG